MSEKHLSDEWLSYMVTTKFSWWLQPFLDKENLFQSAEPLYALDLEFMQDIEAKPGYERHGGCIVIDKTRVVGIILHGKRYVSADPEWECVKYKLRATSFFFATLHHTSYHLRECGKFFTATHRFLPRTHPLNQLLLRFF